MLRVNWFSVSHTVYGEVYWCILKYMYKICIVISIHLYPHTNVYRLVQITLYLMEGNLIWVDKVNSTWLSFCTINKGNQSFGRWKQSWLEKCTQWWRVFLTVEIIQRQINSNEWKYYYRVFALLYALRKDIHNASVHSFAHNAKLSISCVKWGMDIDNLTPIQNFSHRRVYSLLSISSDSFSGRVNVLVMTNFLAACLGLLDEFNLCITISRSGRGYDPEGFYVLILIKG